MGGLMSGSVGVMESIHPQQLFPDVWLHCVQKCQQKGLLCTGMVLSPCGWHFWQAGRTEADHDSRWRGISDACAGGVAVTGRQRREALEECQDVLEEF